MNRDDDARAAGFEDDDKLQAYLREEDSIDQWVALGAPDAATMARKLSGMESHETALTIQQAAARLGMEQQYVRRRLNVLQAMDPPGAWREGKGDRAPWRLRPSAVDRLHEAGTVEPKPAKPPRGKSKAQPKKRSATRWEV